MGRWAAFPPIGPAAVAAAALAVAAFAGAAPAAAQVLEIAPDGQVTRYAGPALYTDRGARSLLPQADAPPAASPPAQVQQAIAESAERHAVSAPLAQAVAWQESRFRQDVVSPKGALGVMQLMPATARTLGVDALDLKGNVEGGVAYLQQMLARFGGDLPRALAAYNAGPEAVQRYGGVPPYAETRAYVRAILGRLSAASAVGAGVE